MYIYILFSINGAPLGVAGPKARCRPETSGTSDTDSDVDVEMRVAG